MSETTILTITFSLLNNPDDEKFNNSMMELQQSTKLSNQDLKLLPIKYTITEHIKKENDGSVKSELNKTTNYLSSDNEKSFLNFTNDLSRYMKTLHYVLPHISTDVLKSDVKKKELLQTTSDAQTKVIALQSQQTESEEKISDNVTQVKIEGSVEELDQDFGWFLNSNEPEDVTNTKKLIKYLYAQTKTTPEFEEITNKLTTDSGLEELITTVLNDEKVNEGDRKLDNLKSYLKGAKYLGKHSKNGEKDRYVFLTKEGILTDGFKILPFNTTTVKGDVNDENSPVEIIFPLNYPLYTYAGGPFWLKDEYDSVSNKLKTQGYYGGNKTSSQRPSKKRSTRRIRK